MREGLPTEWVRGPQWASPAARLEWELVLTTAQAAWAELELLSVSEGVREAALLHLTPEELVRATHDAAGQGLLVVPLACEGGQTRAALTRPPRFADWLEAWSGCDDEAIGELLGFPGCCREHFCRTWGRGMTDTVTTIASGGNVDGPPEANVMLRHLGVRLVPHLPCSPTCEATVALGKDLAHVVARAGVDPGPLYRLLNLPVTYSALHGVAVIETPHFRLWAGTDYTPDEVKVTRAATETRAVATEGENAIPECQQTARSTGEIRAKETSKTTRVHSISQDNMHGLQEGIPTIRSRVRSCQREKVVRNSDVRRGVSIEGKDSSRSRQVRRGVCELPSGTNTWEDNGFATREAMDAAHDVVLKAVRPFVERGENGVKYQAKVDSAVDLGCGDGALLARIADGREGRWVGVEVDHGRLERGRQRHNDVIFHEADIMEWAQDRTELEDQASLSPFDTALLMPGRLLEMTPEDADRVRGALPKLARRLVAYAYGDVLEQHGGLEPLASEAGLKVTGQLFIGPGVEAAEAEVAT